MLASLWLTWRTSRPRRETGAINANKIVGNNAIIPTSPIARAAPAMLLSGQSKGFPSGDRDERALD